MRVFITGLGLISPLGNTKEDFFQALSENKSGICQFPEWGSCNGLHSLLGAPAQNYDSKIIPRHVRRTMSKMSEMSFLATKSALESANLNFENESINSDRVILNIGSTTGSPFTLESFFQRLITRGIQGQLATDFFKIMNHSVGANVASGLGYCGPMISSSSACSTSTQAIINGYELIKSGLYDVAIVGGADELHYMSAGIFDIVNAASRGYNDFPDKASRPFDKDRDGLVVAEGAATLIIESERHAKNRGARAFAEILGGAYLCDGTHMSQPQVKSMIHSMKMALERSGLSASQVGYVNAHATSTIMGDIEESHAIEQLFGDQTPVSSIKGHLGHTLAACGGIETIATIQMMKEKTLIKNRNLFEVDPRCAKINLLKENVCHDLSIALINNFAFGGMSTSLILKSME